jgi:hypothetical protein
MQAEWDVKGLRTEKWWEIDLAEPWTYYQVLVSREGAPYRLGR